MSGQDYNSHLMSSLHKGGGKGNVNLTLFAKQDEMLKKMFGDPKEAMGQSAQGKVEELLGGNKGFSLAGGSGGPAVFHTADPKSFEYFTKSGQIGFSQAGAGTVLSTASYMMNPMVQMSGQGMMGFQQMMSIRPFSGIQGGFLGYQGFGGIGGNMPMQMSGQMNFPSFGMSNANFSTGGGGGGGAAAMAGGGGGGSSRGLPSMAGVSFGGDISQAALGQMSARSAAPMNLSLMGGGGPELG